MFDVSWGDTARFVNWLANGQLTAPEGSGTTETGTYTLNGGTSNAGYDGGESQPRWRLGFAHGRRMVQEPAILSRGRHERWVLDIRNTVKRYP